MELTEVNLQEQLLAGSSFLFERVSSRVVRKDKNLICKFFSTSFYTKSPGRDESIDVGAESVAG